MTEQSATLSLPKTPRIGGFLLVLGSWLTAAWLVVGTLVAPVVPGHWLTVLAAALVVTALPIAAFVHSRRHGRYPGALFRIVVLRTFWYAQLLLILLAVAGLAGAVIGLPFLEPALVGRGAIVVAAVIAVALGVAGYAGAHRLRVRELEVALPKLPPALDGLRIAQISDTHVGPHTSRRFLARVRQAVENAEPHLIAVTGDLVDDHAEDVEHYGAALGDLAAPLGVYAIAGNHDVYASWPRVRARLSALPLRVLVNESAVVEHAGERIAIVGTGDPAARGDRSPDSAAPDIGRALAGVPRDAFVVALAHNPALWPALAERGVPLTLSGHTHWGQLAIPSRRWSLAGVFLQLAMGLYRKEDSVLYVHPGTGYWGIPFRLGARPEVALMTLRTG